MNISDKIENLHCMPLDELLAMAEPKLKALISKLVAKAIKDGLNYNIYDIKTKWYDVELEDDFDRNMMMYFEPNEVDEELENDGWFDADLEKGYAKLLRGWNWDDVTLTDGTVVVITQDEFSQHSIDIHLHDSKKLYDGAIDRKYWLSEIVNPLLGLN